MPTFEKVPTIEPSNIAPERRTAIGSQVIGIAIMTQIADHLSHPDHGIAFSTKPNTLALRFFETVATQEFATIRHGLVDKVLPHSNAHIAKHQLGLISRPLKDGLGNSYYKINSDFIVATHYLEDQQYAEKLNSEIQIIDLLEDCQEDFEAFYTDRALRVIGTSQHSSDLREIVYSSVRDAEYWLEH